MLLPTRHNNPSVSPLPGGLTALPSSVTTYEALKMEQPGYCTDYATAVRPRNRDTALDNAKNCSHSPTPRTTQWVERPSFSVVRWPARESHHARMQSCVHLHLHAPSRLHGVVLSGLRIGTFFGQQLNETNSHCHSSQTVARNT
jgi:hypothetical protein